MNAGGRFSHSLILSASISLLCRLFLFIIFSVLFLVLLLLLLRPDTWKLTKRSEKKIIKTVDPYGRHVTNSRSVLINRILSLILSL